MLLEVVLAFVDDTLNESPSEKEGKYPLLRFLPSCPFSLNESPSEKEGK